MGIALVKTNQLGLQKWAECPSPQPQRMLQSSSEYGLLKFILEKIFRTSEPQDERSALDNPASYQKKLEQWLKSVVLIVPQHRNQIVCKWMVRVGRVGLGWGFGCVRVNGWVNLKSLSLSLSGQRLVRSRQIQSVSLRSRRRFQAKLALCPEVPRSKTCLSSMPLHGLLQSDTYQISYLMMLSACLIVDVALCFVSIALLVSVNMNLSQLFSHRLHFCILPTKTSNH